MIVGGMTLPEDMAADKRWWVYGEYTGDDCPNCGRQRLMTCEDNDGRERVICEKCSWEPAANDYCYEAIER